MVSLKCTFCGVEVDTGDRVIYNNVYYHYRCLYMYMQEHFPDGPIAKQLKMQLEGGDEQCT